MLRTISLTVFLVLLLATGTARAAQAADSGTAAGSGGSLTSKYLAGKLYAQAALDAEKLARAYEADMDKTGYYKLLNLQRLETDPDLSKGKAILVKAREVAATYKARSRKLMEEGGSRIAALDTDEETRARLAASWERHQSEAAAEVNEAWRLESAVLDRMSEVVDLLARAKGKWRVAGQSVAFDRTEDAAEYTRRIKAAQTAMQAQDAFESQAQKKAFQKLLEIAQ